MDWLHKNAAIISLVAFIVLTMGIVLFAGLEWFDSRLDRIETSLSGDITNLDNRLDERIDRLGTSLEKVQSTLDERLRTVENDQARLDERLRSVEDDQEQ